MGNVRAFARDLRAGFVRLLFGQLAFLRGEGRRYDALVAVGDVYALGLSLLARVRTVYVGTAKSVYVAPYGRFERSVLARAARVFVRDEATAQRLRGEGVAAEAPGNVIADLVGDARPAAPGAWLGVLPGSREEAYADGVKLARAVRALGARAPVEALFSVAPRLDPQRFAAALAADGWTVVPAGPLGSFEARAGGARLAAWRGELGPLLRAVRLVMGQAGTANEAAAASGVPIVALADEGPEPWYRMRQRRLLGEAVKVVPASPEAAAAAVSALLGDGRSSRGWARSAGSAWVGPAGRPRSRPPSRSSSREAAVQASPLTRVRARVRFRGVPPLPVVHLALERLAARRIARPAPPRRGTPGRLRRGRAPARARDRSRRRTLAGNVLADRRVYRRMVHRGGLRVRSAHGDAVRRRRGARARLSLRDRALLRGSGRRDGDVRCAVGQRRARLDPGLALVALKRPALLYAISHGRATATFVVPGEFAGYLLMLVPTAIGVALASKRPWLRALAWTAAAAGIAALLATFSRAGLAGLVAGGLFAAVAGRRTRVAALVATVAVAALAIAAFAYDAHHNPAEDFSRLSIWRTGLRAASCSGSPASGRGLPPRLSAPPPAQRRAERVSRAQLSAHLGRGDGAPRNDGARVPMVELRPGARARAGARLARRGCSGSRSRARSSQRGCRGRSTSSRSSSSAAGSPSWRSRSARRGWAWSSREASRRGRSRGGARRLRRPPLAGGGPPAPAATACPRPQQRRRAPFRCARTRSATPRSTITSR